MAGSPRPTPVDWDHGSGHIIGQIGREEFDDLGAILDCPESSKGDQLSPISVALAAAWNDGRRDSTVEITPCDAV